MNPIIIVNPNVPPKQLLPPYIVITGNPGQSLSGFDSEVQLILCLMYGIIPGELKKK